MTANLLAISAAYVVLGVLLLAFGLTAPFRWWVKAAAIVVTSLFFVEAFFSTKSLLGWPGTGRLPPRFQLLWTRVVEPDPRAHDAGSIFLWVEEVDANNVPTGTPRSYRLPYTKPMADRSLKARDEIMSGNPQEGTAEDMATPRHLPGRWRMCLTTRRRPSPDRQQCRAELAHGAQQPQSVGSRPCRLRCCRRGSRMPPR